MHIAFSRGHLWKAALLFPLGFTLFVGARPAVGTVDARVLSSKELAETRGGATIDIVVPNSTESSTRATQPLVAFDVDYSVQEDLQVFTYVNGTKTGVVDVAHEDFDFKDIRVLMPWPFPSGAAVVELKHCARTLADAGMPCPLSSFGGDSQRTFRFQPEAKVAGVNFWNLRAGSQRVRYDSQMMIDAIDPLDGDAWESSTDGILAGLYPADNATRSDTFGCWYAPWGFRYRKTGEITMPNTDCFTPTIAVEGHEDLGDDPLCPEFKQIVDQHLAGELGYVNVVAVKHFTVWDKASKRYVPGYGIDGAHTKDRRWFNVRAMNPGSERRFTTSEFAKTIVHEWGHQLDLDHVWDEETCGVRNENIGLMCGGGIKGRGVTKEFCDAADSYTGTKNLNPNK